MTSFERPSYLFNIGTRFGTGRAAFAESAATTTYKQKMAAIVDDLNRQMSYFNDQADQGQTAYHWLI
jgi:hypothetical protein